MMTPPAALRSDIGDVLSSVCGKDEDLVLAVWLLWERHLGQRSFWAPYIAALPHPTSIVHWSAKQLEQLQDPTLVHSAQFREAAMRAKYDAAWTQLAAAHPGRLPTEGFSYEDFRWAWMTVQARAFGRRLPWTALVPFADSLNHGNTPVVYDFDVDSNGAFRLFASGGDGTRAGQEVFNSYGRRHNQHLCLEYGFAMLHNEWAYASVTLHPPSVAQGLSQDQAGLRTSLLARARMPTTGDFKLRWNKWSPAPLTYLRIVLSSADAAATHTPSQLARSSMDPHREVAALQELRAVYWHALAAYPTSVAEDEEELQALGVQVQAGSAVHSAAWAEAAAAAAADPPPTWLKSPLPGQFGTPAPISEAVESSAVPPSLAAARHLCALTYRLTTKRILQQQLVWTHAALAVARTVAASAESGVGSGKLGIPTAPSFASWVDTVVTAAHTKSVAAVTCPVPVKPADGALPVEAQDGQGAPQRASK